MMITERSWSSEVCMESRHLESAKPACVAGYPIACTFMLPGPIRHHAVSAECNSVWRRIWRWVCSFQAQNVWLACTDFKWYACLFRPCAKFCLKVSIKWSPTLRTLVAARNTILNCARQVETIVKTGEREHVTCARQGRQADEARCHLACIISFSTKMITVAKQKQLSPRNQLPRINTPCVDKNRPQAHSPTHPTPPPTHPHNHYLRKRDAFSKDSPAVDRENEREQHKRK